MYELSVAYRYLLPRLREISVSVISLISVFVIALVVWLIIVFFSATEGLEKRWTERLVAITGPARLTPNDAYFSSYYHLIDSASSASHFRSKSLQEKLQATDSDPYNPLEDPPLSPLFPQKELNAKGEMLDIMHTAYTAITSIPGVECAPFETAFATIKIQISKHMTGSVLQELITQPSYIINWDEQNLRMKEALLPTHSNLSPSSTQADPVFLPKSFMDAGVSVADTGVLQYQTATATGIQDFP